MQSQSKEIIIKNANIFDYKNGIKGDKKDILISDGKITEKLKDDSSATQIDGTNHIAFPGAIDLRTHFFAYETNYIRAKALDEDLIPIPPFKTLQEQSLRHGFTFLCEFDVPMTQSKLTLQNMKNSPLLDHAMIMDFGSNWTFFPDFQVGGRAANIAAMFSKLLEDLKGYGTSINCPYHPQFWNLSEPIPGNAEEIPLFHFKIKDVFGDFVTATETNEFRAINFLSPYNIENPLQEHNHLELLQGILDLNLEKKSPHRNSYIHLCSANQFFTEKIDSLIELYNNNESFEMDITPLIPGQNRALITRDKNLAIRESKKSKIPFSTVDLEFDTEYYITTRKSDSSDEFTIKLWNNWLELVLKLKKKEKMGRIMLASNAPYNMCISDWPKIYSYLLNSDFRNQYIDSFTSDLRDTVDVRDIDKNLDLFDLSGLISSNPAKSLGLGDRKGHIGVNADADVVLFNADPEIIHSAGKNGSDEILKGFSNASIIIKSGILIKNGEKISDVYSGKNYPGKIFWDKGNCDDSFLKKVIQSKESFYDKHFSMYMKSLRNNSMKNIEEIN
ncbi:MAG: amidohydrolase family protein [Promethearchaeota archaeon]